MGCTSLSQITIPDSVKYIDNSAFYDCKNLAQITIPSSVIQIGATAFRHCAALGYIDFKGTKEQWNAIPKGGAWDDGTPNYTVKCTDGNLTKA
jgi:hypothetical protein